MKQKCYLNCFGSKLPLFMVVLMANSIAYEFVLKSEAHTRFQKNIIDTGWTSGTAVRSSSEIDTAKGYFIRIKKCVLEDNYLSIKYSTIYRSADQIISTFPNLAKGKVTIGIFKVDSIAVNADSVIAAPRFLDSIPSTMYADVTGDTLKLSFYMLELGNHLVLLDTTVTFQGAVSIIDFYINTKCPSDPDHCVNKIIDKYELTLVRQESKIGRNVNIKHSGKKETMPNRELPVTANGRLLPDKCSRIAPQIMLLNRRSINLDK